MSADYPRDMIGYGRSGLDPQWPDDAYVAVQFVINYEEGGGEQHPAWRRGLGGLPVGDRRAAAWPGERHMNMESIYEYGSRAGFWRLWRLFTQADTAVTVYGVATALERNPQAVAGMTESGWEIASHGLKWIEYKDFDREDERRHMAEAIRIHTEVNRQSRPLGLVHWPFFHSHSLDLVMEEGSFVYSSDSYADELPYWIDGPKGPHLIVPYTLDANDMRFATPQGFNSGDQFFAYLRDSFDLLYEEGKAGAPKMMSVGLHCRLAGRPGRAAALKRFIEHVKGHKRAWVPRRIDIARHWHDVHAL